jgi:predicted transcriptional regulator
MAEQNLYYYSELNKVPESAAPSLCSSYHGKIDWDVARRFLCVLYVKGRMKRTNLAMNTGINYDSCTRYISWMKEIGWIEEEKASNQISLTNIGAFTCSRIFSNNFPDG